MILVKFVLLVTSLVLFKGFSGSCTHGEQAHKCLEQTQIVPNMFSCSLCGSGASSSSSSSVHTGNNSLDVSLIRDQIQSDCSSEGCDGWQRQVKVDTVVSCRINRAVLRCVFTACKYMIVTTTICLYKALFPGTCYLS